MPSIVSDEFARTRTDSHKSGHHRSGHIVVTRPRSLHQLVDQWVDSGLVLHQLGQPSHSTTSDRDRRFGKTFDECTGELRVEGFDEQWDLFE